MAAQADIQDPQFPDAFDGPLDLANFDFGQVFPDLDLAVPVEPVQVANTNTVNLTQAIQHKIPAMFSNCTIQNMQVHYHVGQN